jgi:hypothetical protein
MYLFSKSKLLAPSLSIPKRVQNIAKLLYFFSAKLLLLFAVKLFRIPISFQTPKREKVMEQSYQKKKLYLTAIEKEVHILSYGFFAKKV